MGIFEFLFGLIVFFTAGSVGLAFLAGRAAWRSGRRLMGWARERKMLTGERQQASVEAQDVVIEDVEVDVTSSGGPKPPEDYRRPATPAERARTARQAREQRRTDYVRLDVDTGTTADQVSEVMLGYVDDPILGERAQQVVDTLDGAAFRRRSVFAELDGTFAPGTLSWEHFAVPAQSALDAILRNSALVANRIQAFDTAGYQRLFKSVQRDMAGREHTGADMRASRLRAYQDMLAALDTLLETNDGLLLELDKLSTELSELSGSELTAHGETILEEIRRLTDEAKYYRNA